MPRNFLASGNESYGAYALRSNVAQLSVQVRANRIVCSGDDPSDVHWREKELDEKIRQIDRLLEDGKVTEAIDECEKAISLSKESLYYYRGYQRNRFIFYLTLAWLGWITMLFVKIAVAQRVHVSISEEVAHTYWIRLANIAFIIAVIIILVEDKRKY